jgi:hypothetical protein
LGRTAPVGSSIDSSYSPGAMTISAPSLDGEFTAAYSSSTVATRRDGRSPLAVAGNAMASAMETSAMDLMTSPSPRWGYRSGKMSTPNCARSRPSLVIQRLSYSNCVPSGRVTWRLPSGRTNAVAPSGLV